MNIRSIIKKANLSAAKLRIGISGLSGAGKTMSALKIASGLGKKILLIDTENGRSNWYGNEFNFDIIDFSEVFDSHSPKNYIDLLNEVDKLGYDVVIVDSISTEWQGKGGCIDLADASNNAGINAWGKVTPLHDAFLAKINAMNCHVICTVRQKKKTAIERDKKTGKISVINVSDGDVQRDGWEYNFSVVLTVSNSYCTTKKDNTNILPKAPFIADEGIGVILREYILENKKPTLPTTPPTTPPSSTPPTTPTTSSSSFEDDDQLSKTNEWLLALDGFIRTTNFNFEDLVVDSKVIGSKDDVLQLIKKALQSKDLNEKIEIANLVDRFRSTLKNEFKINEDLSLIFSKLKLFKKNQTISKNEVMNKYLQLYLPDKMEVDLYTDDNNVLVAYSKKHNVFLPLLRKSKKGGTAMDFDTKESQVVELLSKISKDKEAIKAHIHKVFFEIEGDASKFDNDPIDIIDIIYTHYKVNYFTIRATKNKIFVSTCNLDQPFINSIIKQ